MGSGYRTFTAGEVLTASNVQNYLQDQAVMVFGSTALRSSGIGTANFEEGMLTYLTDVDKLQVYNGSSFVDVYPAAATNQGLTLINTTSFSGVTTQSINDVFSATYDYYLIIANIDAPGSANLTFRLRASGSDLSSSVYTNQTLSVTNTSMSAGRSTATAGNLGSLRGKELATQMLIANPFRTVEKSCIVQQADFSASAVTGTEFNDARVGIDSALSYTGITIIGSVANYLTGKVSIYGYNL